MGTSRVIAATGSRRTSDEEHQQVREQKEHPGRVGEGEHPRGNRIGHARDRQEPAEDRRRGDDKQHRRGRLDRVHRDLHEHLQGEGAIPEESEGQGIGRSDDRALGRCEHADGHAAQKDHRRHQREEGIGKGAGQRRPGKRRVAPVVAPVRVPGHGRHHEKAHHDPRDHAREKELSYGDAGHHAVDDERQRRRNDGPERRRGGGHADGEVDRVAVVLHRLDLDGAQARGIGDRGARHSGEDHRADDVHVSEPAFQPSHEGEREVVDAWLFLPTVQVQKLITISN